MIGSILAIGFLSFIVWGHHMFITGMNPFLGSVFVFTTLLIAIPSAVKVFNYITTLWKGALVLTPAMLFAIGLVSTFITGGVTGIILADSALDIAIHDTYFVVAHFHIVMGMSVMDLNVIVTVFAIIAALGQMIFLFNFFYSIYWGQKAPQNPWRSNTLEWTTPVEHIHGNWPGDLPTVHRWPYDYSKPGADDDFIPQTVPLKEGEEEH